MTKKLMKMETLSSDDFADRVDSRRMSVMANKINSQEILEIQTYPKTDTERKKIEKMLRLIYIFGNLNGKHFSEVVDYVYPRSVTGGEVIMTEDEPADNFYIIDKGHFKVSRSSEKVELRIYKDEGYFGELALIHNSPRCATVTALSSGLLWVLDGKIFRNLVQKAAFEQRKRYESLLRTAKVLNSLNNYEKTRLSDALNTIENKKGDVIVEEGKLNNQIYVIAEGQVEIIKTVSGKKVVKIILKENDIFGIEGVMYKKNSSFLAQALTNCKLVIISEDAYNTFLSTLNAALKVHEENFLKEINN